MAKPKNPFTTFVCFACGGTIRTSIAPGSPTTCPDCRLGLTVPGQTSAGGRVSGAVPPSSKPRNTGKPARPLAPKPRPVVSSPSLGRQPLRSGGGWVFTFVAVLFAALLVGVAATLLWRTSDPLEANDAEKDKLVADRASKPVTDREPDPIVKAEPETKTPPPSPRVDKDPEISKSMPPPSETPKPLLADRTEPKPITPEPRPKPATPPTPSPAPPDPPVTPKPANARPSFAKNPAEFVFPKTADEIRSTLTMILDKHPVKRDMDGEVEAALRRLKAYRFLAGVPYHELATVPERNHQAMAAARICAQIGGLSHNPPNPGLPVDQYEYAHTGAQNSNLSMMNPPSSLAKHVDNWIEDGGDSNIQALGHRRWCLNPSLANIGFGRVELFAAMWTTDLTTPRVEDIPMVAFPPPGFLPIDFFQPKSPWSLSLNTRFYKTPILDKISVHIYPVEGNQPDRDHPLEIRQKHIDAKMSPDLPCITLEPLKVVVASGRRYWIEVEGLETTEGEAAVITYLVEFISRK